MGTKSPQTRNTKPPPLDITYRPTEALRADPRNARLHSPRQLRHLTESIQSFGFNVPVLIDADDRVLAGHARLLAAQELGLRQVPTIRLEHLSPEQARAFQIADNRLTELSTWDDQLLAEQLQELAAVDLDFSIEATGFSMGEIDLRIEGLAAMDVVDPADSPPDLKTQAVSAPGDLWQLGEHRILCSNALDEASYRILMAGDKAAMVFSDQGLGLRKLRLNIG